MSAFLTTDVNQAAELLRKGKLVAFATETVYGLGANALDVNAVARVFSAKQRPHFDPLIVHLASAAEVDRVVASVPPVARQLMDRFWPGPLTLVLPKQEIVPDLVTAGLPSVAVRVPDHELARELIRESGVPVAAPSANPFGRISPTTAQHVLEHLREEIDAVLDGGPCRIGVESTVLQVVPGEAPCLLRPGGLTREEIEAEIGPITEPAGDNDEHAAQVAPGRLLKHYAPRKRLFIVSNWSEVLHPERNSVLALEPFPGVEHFAQREVLTSDGDLTQAAARFFSALRRLDDGKSEAIYARRFPDHGLGKALNDRLTRAAR